jgi:zinc finger CCCH domain-containing protein 13
LQEQSNNKFQETYVVEKYKAQVEIAVNELEKNFKEYEKSPEKHPLYSEEWKAFWSRRYKELTAQGKNANDHDYKPEWISFWTKRMKELHNIEIDKKQEFYRKKLGLSIDAVSRIGPTIPRRRSRSPESKPDSKSSYRSSRSPKAAIEISDDSSDDDEDDDMIIIKHSPKTKRYRYDNTVERSKSHEYRSRDAYNSDYRSRDAHDSGYRSRDVHDSSNYRRDYERSRRSKSPDIIEEGPINLISVCRFLTALEPELGLLAKTIIDLLAKAVAEEKKKANSADNLLFDSENCNILETVKEKLKGVLTANLISSNKITAVKRAVQNIATLLHENSKKVKENRNEGSSSSFKVNSANDEDDSVAKAKLQIATAISEQLIKEGKFNVSAEELEALVESFIKDAQNAAGDDDDDDDDDDDEEMEEKPETKPEVKPINKEVNNKQESANTGGLENLTDEDLKTLLRNFADLNSDEQSHLIAYLTKIEQTDPVRVEKLRKYVNIGEADEMEMEEKEKESVSEVDKNLGRRSPLLPQRSPLSQELSDDDDDLMAGKFSHSHHADNSNSRMSSGSSSYANAPGQSTLKDNLVIADNLMTSLMQSSSVQPPTQQWPVEMPNYYPPQQMPQYQNMNMYDQQMMMNMQMGMPMMPQPSTSWPQSAATSFFQERQGPIQQSSSQFHREKANYHKKNPSSNNLQLTGKRRK